MGVTRRGDSRENILQGVKGRKCASSGESVPQKRNSHSSLGRPLTRPPPSTWSRASCGGVGEVALKTKSAYTLFHSSALFTETPPPPPPRADIIKGTLKELQPFTVPKWDQRDHVTEVAPAWTLLLTTLETKKKKRLGFRRW